MAAMADAAMVMKAVVAVADRLGIAKEDPPLGSTGLGFSRLRRRVVLAMATDADRVAKARVVQNRLAAALAERSATASTTSIPVEVARISISLGSP
jgi:hypothetical protein